MYCIVNFVFILKNFINFGAIKTKIEKVFTLMLDLTL